MRTSLACARRQVGLSGQLMRQGMLIKHLLSMRLRCSGKRWIPLQGLQSIVGAGLVGEVKKFLLLHGWNLLGVGEQAEEQWKQEWESQAHIRVN
jgi:hypothetical protein